MTNLVGYKLFLPAITAAVYNKKKQDEQLTESEFKDVVAITFRDAAIQFMKDSLLYRIEVPVDLYQDVKRYDIIAPDGFITEDIISLKEHKVNIPHNCYDLKSIMLTCCPVKDIYSAFFIEIALSPKRSSGICEFDEEFIEMHYDAILYNMFMRLTAMPQRLWRSLGSVDRYKRDYLNKLNRAKRQSLNGGSPIKIHTRRLSSNDSSC